MYEVTEMFFTLKNICCVETNTVNAVSRWTELNLTPDMSKYLGYIEKLLMRMPLSAEPISGFILHTLPYDLR